MTSILFSWLASEDVAAMDDDSPEELGPTLRAARDLGVDRVVLLTNNARSNLKAGRSRYTKWLASESGSQVTVHTAPIKDPSDHVAIMEAATSAVEAIQKPEPDAELHFLLSAGTPAMHAVWLLLGTSRFRASLIKCSIESGTSQIDLPFSISTDFATELLAHADERLVRLTQGLPPEAPAFNRIVAGCRPMKEAVAIATRLAPREVPVLILGESGTGKEVFARSIHQASRRHAAPFIALNCGAIPAELVDARLFGHAKGAFTGAAQDTKGVFEEADGGTLFLDEIGELPLEAQVRLLRVLQEEEVVRVGEHKPRAVSVRLLAATHIDLFQAVQKSRFRADLLYRLAVGLIHLPALRDRGRDVHTLIDTLLPEVQKDLALEPDFRERTLTKEARARLLSHSWPGNVRELRTTLVRATLYGTAVKIGPREIEEALLPIAGPGTDTLLTQPFDDAFDIKELMNRLRSHYVERAMGQTHGNKAEAARLMRIAPQTFQSWT